MRPLVRAHYADWARRGSTMSTGSPTTAARQRDLRAFVAELTIDPARAAPTTRTAASDEDYLTLSTVHSAKGLEWTAVHVLHAVDGAFPSDMALTSDDGLAEEQRLFYVAVTRARDTLASTRRARMPVDWNGVRIRNIYAKASRFLTVDALRTLHTAPADSGEGLQQPADVPATVTIPALSELFA